MQVTKPSTTGGSWILKQRSILQPVPFARPDSRECRRCGRSTCAKSVSYVPGSKAGIPKKSCAHVVLKHWTPVEVLLARSRGPRRILFDSMTASTFSRRLWSSFCLEAEAGNRFLSSSNRRASNECTDECLTP